MAKRKMSSVEDLMVTGMDIPVVAKYEVTRRTKVAVKELTPEQLDGFNKGVNVTIKILNMLLEQHNPVVHMKGFASPEEMELDEFIRMAVDAE